MTGASGDGDDENVFTEDRQRPGGRGYEGVLLGTYHVDHPDPNWVEIGVDTSEGGGYSHITVSF